MALLRGDGGLLVAMRSICPNDLHSIRDEFRAHAGGVKWLMERAKNANELMR